MVKKYYRRILIFPIAAFLFVVILSCKNLDQDSQESGIGSIVAKLVWIQDVEEKDKSVVNSPEYAAIPSTVTTIRGIVSGPDMSTIEKDNDVSEGKGRIDNIPAGSGRSLTLQGLDSNGSVEYQGEATSITITVGQVSDVGTITMTSYIGTVTSLKLTSDSANNVYIGGHTSTDLDTNTVIGEADMFLIKYTSDGTRLWSSLSGSTENDYMQGLTITPSDQTVMTGYTYGTLSSNSSNGGVDMLLIKTAADGSMVWEKQFGTDGDDYAYGVTTDSTGDIYVAGHTYGSFAETITGTKDFVLVKLDSSGDQIWARQLSNDEDDGYTGVNGTYGIAVKTDAAGNVYAGGFTTGTLDGNSSSGAYDLFVVKYDSAGNLAWIKQLGSEGNDYIRGLQVTAAGEVYLTGFTDGDLDGQTNAGEEDIFLAKLDTSGNIAWIRQTGTENSEYGNDIALDGSEEIYLTGYTSGDLGGASLGGSDFLIMKYDATGDVSWTKQLGTSSPDLARGITIDTAGELYLTGYTYGEPDGNSNTDMSYTSFLSRYNASGNLSWTETF